MSVIRTCQNCTHYHTTLSDYSGEFHIHDYCDVWRAQIPNDVILLRQGFDSGFDDIESGIASCHAFEEADVITLEEEVNKMANDAVAKLRDIKAEYDDDPEVAHMLADDVLCELLISLGYDLVVAEYNGISKWYG